MQTEILKNGNIFGDNANDHVIVSVVIPTRNRPKIVSRAVKSALAQTLQAIEVIVIIDGPDEETVKSLSQIADSRLKVIELLENVGASEARNVGVREAQSTWIAFLDDDDEWLPRKLKLQLELAEHSQFKLPVVSSRFIALTSKGELIWPRRLIAPAEPLSNYLFARNSLFAGEGFMHTSTFFTKKELLIKVPFNNKKYKHEDWEWLLQVSNLENVGIEFVSEPTAYWHSDIGRQRLSNMGDWQYSLEWIRSVQHLVTSKAYSGFIMTIVSHEASIRKDWSAFWILLRESIKLGKPRLIDYLLYMVIWLLPQDLRQQIRALAKRFKSK
ncbi:glycosyltransferase family 2 protein [Halotia branconii]|uniref:Glycosyltransferase family 2 protein n=1 Tax=Halotia branconii CENA392 TaxID=1539056 RepID=A0AAJ6NW12_9CYAN|nr:glycosyltransferase family 2 protein [Halotia branconii]WGV27784.1 glycosyltransferase family 2 protein [Halotia branconii CENA392]